MARREWAKEYEVAPRARFNNTIFSLTASGGATPSAELTALIPTLEEADGAPEVDVLMTFTLQDPESGPAIGFGAAAAAAISAYHHFNVTAGKTTVRVRKVRPRLNAAATTLLDGQRLWIFNTDAVNAYADISVVVEVPSLNWD